MAEPSEEKKQAWKPKFNPWLIAIAVMTATFMEILDTSIANVALPHIAGSMASTTDEATWMTTSYLVANAVVLPLTGWIGATFGRKRFLITCVILFTIASGLSGAAQSLTQLIIFRIIQGAGGGAMQPTAQSIMLESFPPAKRGLAMAFYGVGVVVAPILGPIVGGWLTDNYSWRWSFYINVPIGILAVSLISILIEDPPYLKQQKTSVFDKVGFFFLILWIAALQIMLDKGETDDWFGSEFIVMLAITFVTFLICFIVWEVCFKAPVVDLSVFKDRTFAISTFLITIVGGVLYGSTLLTPLYLQNLLGYPAYDAGLAVAPRGAGAMAAMFVVGPLLARLDGRYFVALGFFLLGTGNIWMGRLNLNIGIIDMAWPNVLNGFGTGLIFVPLVTIANDKLSASQIGAASGIFNLMRNLGGGLGIAGCTTLLARGTQRHQAYLSENISEFSQKFLNYRADVNGQYAAALGPNSWLGPTYKTVITQSSLLSYVDAYTMMGLCCWGCAPLVLLLSKPSKGGAPPPGAH